MIESLSTITYCYNMATEQISIGLLLYAHIPTSVSALLFSLFILSKKKSVASYSFFGISFNYFLWCFLNLNTWFAFIGAENTMFAWSLVDFFGLLFFFFSYRFLYTYIYGTDLRLWQWIVGIGVILPTAFITSTGYNILGFNTMVCEAVENELSTSYTHLVQLFFIIAILSLGVYSYFKQSIVGRKREIAFATTGLLLFLGFFFTSSLVASIFADYTSIENPYNYEVYGLFGMPVLLVFLGYLIIQYRAFNIKVHASQMLVVALIALIGSQLFFIRTNINRILTILTLIIASVGGYLLILSVKKEIKQREEITRLASELKKANEDLKVLDKMKTEFVSIASHQLRAPLTSINGYSSMLMEGTYGKMSPSALGALSKIYESGKFMALSVEDYLSASRIDGGRMQYDLEDFDIKNTTEKLVDELRPLALKKGLLMLFRSQCSTDCIIHADLGKTRQVLTNLIDNSMKYTPTGNIVVVVHDDPKAKTIRVSIQDTGVGMDAETLEGLFEKFVRAKNAHKVNVTGTGLGLYVVKSMVEEMGGKVWAESAGVGQGSKFCVEFGVG